MKLPSSFAAIATGILLGAMMPSASFAQYFGRNKIQYNNYEWHVLSTPHFDIHYYTGAEAFAVRAGLVLEDGYDDTHTSSRRSCHGGFRSSCTRTTPTFWRPT